MTIRDVFEMAAREKGRALTDEDVAELLKSGRVEAAAREMYVDKLERMTQKERDDYFSKDAENIEERFRHRHDPEGFLDFISQHEKTITDDGYIQVYRGSTALQRYPERSRSWTLDPYTAFYYATCDHFEPTVQRCLYIGKIAFEKIVAYLSAHALYEVVQSNSVIVTETMFLSNDKEIAWQQVENMILERRPDYLERWRIYRK